MTLSYRRLFQLALIALSISGIPAHLPAADFIRGDTNGDGSVTVADAAFLLSNLFFGSPRSLPCEAAADFEDDEFISITDALRILEFAAGSGNAPASPYPVSGPDTTSSEGYQVPCASYGNSPIREVSDPSARLRIVDAIAPGGDDVHATVVVEVSSSLDLWSYSGRVAIGGALLEDLSYENKDRIGLEVLNEPFRSEVPRTAFATGRVQDGDLSFGFISSLSEISWMPPGSDVPAMALTVCLREGTPPGVYEMTFEEGEMTKAWSGNNDPDPDPDAAALIRPALEGGTLTVLETVAPGGNCAVRPLEWDLNARFELAGATAPPGTIATLPFALYADRACEGFAFEVGFDRDVLEAVAIRPLYPEPDEGEDLQILNDEGKLRCWVRFSNGPEHALPARRTHQLLELEFLVNPETTATTTEIVFQGYNSFRSFEDTYTVETADSFVLVNGFVSVLPDGTLFIRGDSNGDEAVDVSDALTTLGYLFLRAAPRPACYDAADANDDGLIDLSDGIAVLNHLFVGTGDLPAPSGIAGSDPTPDSLGCSHRGR
jgi:hypothetical protein